MINFNFSEKGLGLVSQPHFVYNFSGKMFLMLHCISHGIIIRTGTCNKIPSYMHDSACRSFVVKKAKIF